MAEGKDAGLIQAASDSASDSSTLPYVEMEDSLATQKDVNTKDPLLGGQGLGQGAVHSSETDPLQAALSAFSSELQEHINLADDEITFPLMSGGVISCGAEDHPADISMESATNDAAVADPHSVVEDQYFDARSQESKEETGMETGDEFEDDDDSPEPRGGAGGSSRLHLTPCLVKMSPLQNVADDTIQESARRYAERKTEDPYTTERSKGPPFPDDTSYAATYTLDNGQPVHTSIFPVIAGNDVTKAKRPRHYGVLEPHRQFVYREDGATHVRWGGAGGCLEYKVVAFQKDLWNHFASVPTDEDSETVIEDTFVQENVMKLSDPQVSSGKNLGKTVDFLQGQCCPVVGCDKGPDTSVPAIAQKSRFTYMAMVRHFLNRHINCQKRTLCRYCGYTSFSRKDFTQHLLNRHGVDIYKSTSPDFKKGARLSAAHAFTTFVTTLAQEFVSSDGLIIDFSIYFDNGVPTSTRYKNWGDMSFPAFDPSEHQSHWWNPQANCFRSHYGKDETDPVTGKTAKDRAVEASSRQDRKKAGASKRDPSPMTKKTSKMSKTEKLASPVVLIPAGAESTRDRFKAPEPVSTSPQPQRGRGRGKLTWGSDSQSRSSRRTPAPSPQRSHSPLGGGPPSLEVMEPLDTFQESFTTTSEYLLKRVDKFKEATPRLDSLAVCDNSSAALSHCRDLCSELERLQQTTGTVLHKFNDTVGQLLKGYHDSAHHLASQAAKHKNGYDIWEKDGKALRDSLTESQAKVVVLTQKVARLEAEAARVAKQKDNELKALKAEVSLKEDRILNLTAELREERKQSAAIGRELTHLRAGGPTAEQERLERELEAAKAASTTFNNELMGSKAALELKQECLTQTQQQLITATTRVGELEREAREWKDKFTQSDTNNNYLCQKVYTLQSQLTQVGLAASPSTPRPNTPALL